MLRQRIRVPAHPATVVTRTLVVLLALALGFYGVMTMLLAVGVSPHTVNQISAYRSIYHQLATVKASNITTTVRIVTAVVGVVCFLVFSAVALKALPRPHLARQELTLDDGRRGETVIEPRALERLAEVAAAEHEAVSSVGARYLDGEMVVDISVDDPERALSTLEDVQSGVADALARHQLPVHVVTVTLAGIDDKEREVA